MRRWRRGTRSARTACSGWALRAGPACVDPGGWQSAAELASRLQSAQPAVYRREMCRVQSSHLEHKKQQCRSALVQVLVLDWDVHHGNGTQDIFYEDPTGGSEQQQQQKHQPPQRRPAAAAQWLPAAASSSTCRQQRAAPGGAAAPEAYAAAVAENCTEAAQLAGGTRPPGGFAC